MVLEHNLYLRQGDQIRSRLESGSSHNKETKSETKNTKHILFSILHSVVFMLEN